MRGVGRKGGREIEGKITEGGGGGRGERETREIRR